MGILQTILGLDRRAGPDIDRARRVVQEYSNFIITSAPMPGCVADASRLPFAKQLIKDSLFTCISLTADRELIEELKHGCLMLTAWQDDVGAQTLGLDFTDLDLESDPLELAEIIRQRTDSVTKWKPLIAAEQAEIWSELRALCR